jgi:hypothetical protein
LRQQPCIFRINQASSDPGWADQECIMQFRRIITPVKDLQIWNASSSGYSFVISFESRSGPGLRGRTGYLASWCPIGKSRCAIKIGGSPFGTLAEAEVACTAMLVHLIAQIDQKALATSATIGRVTANSA